MKCFHCGQKIVNEAKMVLLNADGDFACDNKCALDYNTQKDYFLNIILPNDELYNKWIKEL